MNKFLLEEEDEEEIVKEKKGKGVDDKIELALLDKRRIFLSDAVDNKSAAEMIRRLWYLDWKDIKPILFFINSPGGSVDSGFAIWDQIKLLKSPVYTIVTGLAASFGSLLSLAAGKGKRFATKNARIMIHQPLIGGVIKGAATDLDIQAQEMLKARALIVSIYVEATGKDAKTIEKAIDRDNWMSAEEAKEFGLIDKIISTPKDIEL